MIANRGFHEMMPPGHDADKLPPSNLEGKRAGLAACRQDDLPEGHSRGDVDGAEQVIGGSGDEDQPTRGNHRAAVVRRSDLDRQLP